jgi:hypothetical protein
MQRLFVSLLCLSFLSSSFGQSTHQESLKKEFQAGLYSGCLEKQSQSQLATNSKFNADICSCYAKNSTEQIFSNLDFHIALKNKDDLAIKSAVRQIVTKDNSAITFQQCLNKTRDKFKGEKEPILDKPTKELSTKRGLLDESRDSFIRGGILECIDSAKSSSPNVKAYCSCSVGSMADNISQQDLYEIGINSKLGQKRIKEMGELGIKRCSHLLN